MGANKCGSFASSPENLASHESNESKDKNNSVVNT